jgi:sulfur carrier protein
MSKLKYFLLNGQEYCTNYDLTIIKLIEYFDYNISLVVLEYNKTIWEKKNWNTTFIKDNDKIEIVTIVGGG